MGYLRTMAVAFVCALMFCAQTTRAGSAQAVVDSEMDKAATPEIIAQRFKDYEKALADIEVDATVADEERYRSIGASAVSYPLPNGRRLHIHENETGLYPGCWTTTGDDYEKLIAPKLDAISAKYVGKCNLKLREYDNAEHTASIRKACAEPGFRQAFKRLYEGQETKVPDAHGAAAPEHWFVADEQQFLDWLAKEDPKAPFSAEQLQKMRQHVQECKEAISKLHQAFLKNKAAPGGAEQVRELFEAYATCRKLDHRYAFEDNSFARRPPTLLTEAQRKVLQRTRSPGIGSTSISSSKLAGSLSYREKQLTLRLEITGASVKEFVSELVTLADEHLLTELKCEIEAAVADVGLRGSLNAQSLEDALDQVAKLAGARLSKTEPGYRIEQVKAPLRLKQ